MVYSMSRAVVCASLDIILDVWERKIFQKKMRDYIKESRVCGLVPHAGVTGADRLYKRVEPP